MRPEEIVALKLIFFDGVKLLISGCGFGEGAHNDDKVIKILAAGKLI